MTDQKIKKGGKNKPPKKRSLPLRIFIKTFKWLAISIGLILAIVLILVLFPPIGLFKDTIADTASDTLGVEVRIGDLSLATLSGIDLEDVYVGPPQGGYERPLFELKQLSVHYSVWGAVFSSELVIKEILINSPHVALETVNGKTSIDAILENLGPSEEKPEEPEPEEETPEEPGEPSPFKITLEKLSIKDVRAYADIGTHVVDFHSLGVDIEGFFSQLESHFDVEVNIGGEAGKPNIHFEQRGPTEEQLAQKAKENKEESDNEQDLKNDEKKTEDEAAPPDPIPVKADLELAINIKVAADHVLEPSADVKLDFLLKTHSIETIWELEPVELVLQLKALADMQKDKADLEKLSMSFNKKEMINMRAALNGLLEQKDVDVFIEHIRLPLDTFSPYIKPFVADTAIGGEIAIEKLAVKGEVPKLKEMGLPELNGEINIRDVWANYGPMKAGIKGFSSHLELATRPIEEQTEDVPAISAKGFLKFEEAVYPGAKVKGFNLDLAAQSDSIEPTDARVNLDLSIPVIRYSAPGMGTVAISFATDLGARANMKDGVFALDHLNVNIADTVKLSLKADASVDLESSEVRTFSTELNLEKINFKKAMRLVPPGIKKDIPKMDLGGSMGAMLKASGSIPANFKDPLKLPVAIDTLLYLHDINLNYPDQQLKVSDVNGELAIKGKPSDINIDGKITLAKAIKADQTATLQNLEIPIKVHFKPEDTTAELGATVGILDKKDQALHAEDVSFTANVQVTGNLPKQKFDLFTGEVKLGMGKAHYMKGMTAKLEGQYMQLEFSYDQPAKKGKLAYKFGMKEALYEEMQAKLKDFEFRIGAQVEGVDIPIVRKPDMHSELAWVTMEMDLGELWKTDVFPDEPLRDTSLRSKLELHDMRDADLEKFSFRQPNMGIKYDMSGKFWNVLDDSEGIAKLKVADFATKYPEFDIELFARIDIPEKQKLLGEMFASGMVGLKSRARSLPGNHAIYEGRIVAEDFNLWTTSHGEKLYPDGHTEPTETHLHLKDLDSNVPMIQYLDLEEKTIVQAEGNIFKETGQSALYETMRLYSDINSNFHIDKIYTRIIEGKTEKNLKVDEIALDMIYTDNTFAIDRLYIALMGGAIKGQLQAQLAQLQPVPDVRVHFDNQITGVNLGYLVEKDPKKVSEDTELSMLIDMDFGLQDRYLEGSVDITKLSLKQLDKILIFLDPDGKNPNVQDNRKLINAWYVDMINPQVKLVSMWIKYGNLNMDIKVDAAPGLRQILNNTLKNSKIRRNGTVQMILNNALDEMFPRDKEAAASELDEEAKEFPPEETVSSTDNDTL